MLVFQNRSASIVQTFFLFCLALIAIGLLPVTASAGPLQDKIRTLTYNQKLYGFFNDTTLVYHDPSVGTAVGYLRPRGQLYVWHSHSSAIVSGSWSTSMLGALGPSQSIFCLDVGGRMELPASNNFGLNVSGNTRCYNLLGFSEGIDQILQGDPYGLSGSRTAPAVISDARRHSAQALMQLAGGDESSLRSVDLSR